MTEPYSYDRATFAERAAKLAGRGAFFEPIGGRTTKHDHLPDEHAIAAAFAYARQHPHDTGPDIAVALITGSHAHAKKIVRELAVALASGLQKRKRAEIEAIMHVACDCYMRTVHGKGIGKPEGMPDHAYNVASTLGDSVLWQSASEALFRAERAYRREPQIDRPQALQPA